MHLLDLETLRKALETLAPEEKTLIDALYFLDKTLTEAFYVEGSRMERKDINNASFAYSVNLLRLFLGLQLISEEYKKISRISAAYYKVENICLK